MTGSTLRQDDRLAEQVARRIVEAEGSFRVAVTPVAPPEACSSSWVLRLDLVGRTMSSLPVRAAVTRLRCCGCRADSIRNGSARPAGPAEPFASPDRLLTTLTSTRSPTAEPTPTTR